MDQLTGRTSGLRVAWPSSGCERRFSDTDRNTPGLIGQSMDNYGDGSNPFASQRSNNKAASTDDIAGSHQSLAQHQCETAVCSVAKVFTTPELLDTILCYLDPANVMNFRRTSTIWARVVQNSPYLRLYPFYRPQFQRPAADFQLLEPKIPGLVIEKGDPLALGHWIIVSMTANAARTILPNGRYFPRAPARSIPRAPAHFIHGGLRGGLGFRTQQQEDYSQPARVLQFEGPNTAPYDVLQICQPPVLNMQAFIERNVVRAAKETGGEEPKPAMPFSKLSCETGITLDFLADMTLSLMRSATSEDMKATKVVFKTIVSFCEPAHTAGKRRSDRNIMGMCH